MVQEWAKVIINAVEQFREADPEVFLFHLTLKHRVNDDFRLVLMEMKQVMQDSAFN